MSNGKEAYVLVSLAALLLIAFSFGALFADPHIILGITFRLKEIDWDAIGAVATSLATIVAMATAYLAVMAPERQRAEERSEATMEILKASREALILFYRAKANSRYNKRAMVSEIAVMSDHQRQALDRLLNRVSLTDGAIVTGSAAMSLMDAIANTMQARSMPPYRNNLARLISDSLGPADSIERLLRDRAQRVAIYAVKREWPGWEKRFAEIAEEGLLPRYGPKAPELFTTKSA